MSTARRAIAVPWLRLAGGTIGTLTLSFWLFVLETEAPVLSLLLSVPCIALAGPAWTHPRLSGLVLVALAGSYGLGLLHAVRHPLLGELTLVLPLVLAGLLLLADGLVHRSRESAGRPTGGDA